MGVLVACVAKGVEGEMSCVEYRKTPPLYIITTTTTTATTIQTYHRTLLTPTPL